VGRSLSSITGEDPDFYLGVLSRRCAHKKMIAQGIIVNKKYGYDVQAIGASMTRTRMIVSTYFDNHFLMKIIINKLNTDFHPPT